MIHFPNYLAPCLHIQRRLFANTKIVDGIPTISASAYKPNLVEKRKYEDWEKYNYFTAENSSSKPKFSMILPPPNITGNLHLGHALACTIQDVIARHKRSLGHNVMWLPGTDHAGIATQGVVEKYLKSTQNIDRRDLGREKFVKEVWKWKEKHGDNICRQLRTLGCSLDWSRQAFTMDHKHTHAVNTAFIKLFNKGLIYRKKALVNWCNALNSTVSDIEVDNLEIKGEKELNIPGYNKPLKFGLMYYVAYKLSDTDEEIVVATTMPESILGDTAIAVHPDDERYKNLKDRRVIHPFRNVTIPIIFDRYVDMHFGTGAVKITPAHSKDDYEIASQHSIPLHQVIAEDGTMINSEVFNGMPRYECRNLLVNNLKEMGLLRKITPHHMFLPVCSRTGDVIIHLPKEQWFLSCSGLNDSAAKAFNNGALKIIPEKFSKIWQQWTTDDRDWCISRQLWWGHQIPAYKCSVDKDVVWVAATCEDEAKKDAARFLRTIPQEIQAQRDTDVLDTWFSSGIYPFAALGWPNSYRYKDFSQFYPLNLLTTGHDILGFWVHRMVMLGIELTGEVPFNKVLLHGIICDDKGKKMSKSKGNVIDPMDVINGISLEKLAQKTKTMHENGTLSRTELDKALNYQQTRFSNGIPECGVDALRFTLLSNDIKSHFVNFDLAQCYANKLFCNKIWQSVKYTQMSYSALDVLDEETTSNDLTYFDRWILSRLANMVEKVNLAMINYDFHLATKALRTHMYNEFCDVYLEATKPAFKSKDTRACYAHAHTLSAVLNTSLRSLAPFMVYVTDELIPRIPTFANNIIHNYKDSSKLNKYFDFPQYKDFKKWRDGDLERQAGKLLNTINLIREVKGLYNISSKYQPSVYVKTTDGTLTNDIKNNIEIVTNLARVSEVHFEEKPKNYVGGSLDHDTTVNVELIGEDVDLAVFAAKSKVDLRIKKIEDSLAKLEAKFSSGHYLSKVPEWAQVIDRQKLEKKKQELKDLQRFAH